MSAKRCKPCTTYLEGHYSPSVTCCNKILGSEGLVLRGDGSYNNRMREPEPNVASG